jgi:hypothetical protein
LGSHLVERVPGHVGVISFCPHGERFARFDDPGLTGNEVEAQGGVNALGDIFDRNDATHREAFGCGCK